MRLEDVHLPSALRQSVGCGKTCKPGADHYAVVLFTKQGRDKRCLHCAPKCLIAVYQTAPWGPTASTIRRHARRFSKACEACSEFVTRIGYPASRRQAMRQGVGGHGYVTLDMLFRPAYFSATQ